MSLTDAYIVFELAGSAYGLRSEDVQHIDLLEHITRVPNTAPAVDGVVFARGDVVPAIDLRTRFGLPRQAPTPATRLIFLRTQQRVVALIVDAARVFQRIPREAIRPVEDTLHGVEGNYVRGVATVKGRLVLLLDVAAVLRVDEIALPPGAAALQPAR
ncbi:chemotaxis protein CheW [Horticoccus luteus]|uniref:Chemotaxis protein CheW n=1 Tax=Horticoccus luteus TaxID=2862869 RepID=A0A8F9TZK2_9BACT|nr:chemotaxis protein CheW [Horticoccus luteus]QYM80643.1 chemotaxis protein CheW [Horticoccus luteus]